MRIERGTVVADRYVVSEIVRPWFADFPDIGSVSLVIDAILDQPAVLYAADSAESGDLLDMARRASLLSDPRIPTVQDVGRVDGIDFVICERTGATGLPELLARGPLDPEAARALAGELATAIVHASKRGLHHLCLGPESVALGDDGEVVVHGVAIDAAVADRPYGLRLDSRSGQDQLHEDSLAIVNILYAALTAHWPGEEPRGGLPAAEKKNQLFVRAGAITPGIPRDLEEFVSGVVTRTEAGPRSPSEIVRYLGQWDTRALTRIAQSSSGDGTDLFPSGGAQFTGGTSTADGAGAGSGSSGGAAGESSDSHGGAAAGAGAAAAAGAGAAAGAAAAAAGPTVAGGESRRPSAPTTNVTRPAVSSQPTQAPGASVDDEKHKPTHRATPQQLQAALKRIGMTRPGTSGASAGLADDAGAAAGPLDERMQMRRASTFPISAESIDEAAADTPAWEPEDTYSSYSAYAGQEVDANQTAPIRTDDRDDYWQESEDTQIIATTETRELPIVSEEDDGSWFLGGMFTTREDELARQRREFQRERELQRRAEENARRSMESARTDGRSRGDRPGDRSGIAHDLADVDTAERTVRTDGADADTAEHALPGRSESGSGADVGPDIDTDEQDVVDSGSRNGKATNSRGGGAASTGDRASKYSLRGARSSGRRGGDDATSGNARKGRARTGAAGAGSGAAHAGSNSAGSSGAAASGSKRGAAAAGAGAGVGAAATGVGAAAGARAADGSGSGGRAGTAPRGAGPAAVGSGSAGGASVSGGADGSGRKRSALPLTIAVIVLVVVIALIGFIVLSPGDETPQAGDDATQSAQPAPPEETEETDEETSAEPPTIAAVEALDPEGDDEENSEDAENVLPDEDGTWQSETYNSPEFGNLKSGLGLLLELEEEGEFSEVLIDSETPGGDVEIRVGDSSDPEEAEVVGNGELPDGSGSIELDEPASGSHVFIWIVELPADGGGYRARIADVELG